jgi:hypothetical protein
MGRSIDEQSHSHKVSAVLPRREFFSARAAEGKRVRLGKAASEAKERGRGEKTRSAREVVENASSCFLREVRAKPQLLRSVGLPKAGF